jgi:hypothetical protein
LSEGGEWDMMKKRDKITARDDPGKLYIQIKRFDMVVFVTQAKPEWLVYCDAIYPIGSILTL